MCKSIYLSLLLALLFTSPALAIPVAGTYVFASGPDIAGSFISTGNSISAWSFSSDILDRLFLGSPTPTTQSWSSVTDVVQPGNLNNQNLFITNNAPIAGDPGGYYAQLQWNPNASMLNAVFRVDATCCDAIYRPPPTVSFVLAVSEPNMLWPTIVGMLGIVVLTKRKRLS